MKDEQSLLNEIDSTETESSYLQRALANFFDIIIEFSLLFLFYFLIPQQLFYMITAKFYGVYLVIFLIIFGYRLIALMLMQKTIGMKLVKLKYLNSELLPLSGKQKIIAALAIRYPSIKQYLEK